jgi:hypothetical protein
MTKPLRLLGLSGGLRRPSDSTAVLTAFRMRLRLVALKIFPLHATLLKPQTVAIVAADAEFAINGCEGARENAKAAGLKIVYDKRYRQRLPKLRRS